MKKFKESTKREELINALIDHFGIREPIEAYLIWSEMSYDDLLYIYTCETERYEDWYE